jgi:hypothetical protein
MTAGRICAGEVGHRAAVVPEVLHAAEEVASTEDLVRRAALAEIVGAELVEVPDELDVGVVEGFRRTHPIFGGENPHRDADVLQLVIDVIARVVDRVDHVEHAEQVGTAPDHLLLAQLEVPAAAIGHRQLGDEEGFADEVEPVVEFRRCELVRVGIHVILDAAPAVVIAGSLRHAEGDAAFRLVQIATENNHAVVWIVRICISKCVCWQRAGEIGLVDRSSTMGNESTTLKKWYGRADYRICSIIHSSATVLQQDRPPRILAVLVIIQLVHAIIGATELGTEFDTGEGTVAAKILVGLDLNRIAEL